MRLLYVSFWIDHYSKYVYATFHQTKAASELLASKQEFESWAAKYNVHISSIRADNGVYTAKVFIESCTKKQQNLTFCGIGAHWQNGIAERFIGTITEKARTFLLCAMHKWPSHITKDMGSFSIQHAVTFHNYTIGRGQVSSPFQLFTGEDPTANLGDFKVFGSPTFVLDKTLQDGNNFGKWKPRSLQGIYIGASSCHSSHVPLIYNPSSTHITPQFHVIYDENFYMVDPSITPYTQDHYHDRLYNSTAHWQYVDKHTDTSYFFDSFWQADTTISEGGKPSLDGSTARWCQTNLTTYFSVDCESLGASTTNHHS
jgi:hypothetical protein